MIKGKNGYVRICIPQGVTPPWFVVQIAPASGIIEGLNVCFYNEVVYQFDDCSLIPESMIFLRDGKIKEGTVIVKSQEFEQKVGSITYERQGFFVVELSGIPDINPGDIVVIKPFVAFPFCDFTGAKRYAIEKQNILLHVTPKGIFPGPEFVFVQKNEVLYSKSYSTINIKGTDCTIVKKDDIYSPI
jgi:hypothetical protein